MKKLTLAEVKDLLTGVTILATGGGGRLEKGLRTAEEDYGAGLHYTLAGREEINNDGLYTSPYYCGSIAPELSDDPYHRYTKLPELETVRAVRALERFLGRPVDGIVSIEYGGGNTAVALSTAARLGKPMVDADAAGRAVPDLQFSSFYLCRQNIAPLAVASSIGDVAVFEQVADDFRAEALVRALAVVSGDTVGMTDHPVSGRDLRESVIWGALSYAMAVGKARREAVEAGRDPITAIRKAAGGYLLFRGTVTGDTNWKNKAGFTVGEIHIRGGEGFTGDTYRIWFKNENMLSWKNGKTHVTCPDLICVTDTSGYPILNPDCKDGMEVVVLGFKSPEIWRSERGLSILCPRFFGFDDLWTPIEKLMEDR
jgi:DUF917 family protein